MGIAEAEGRLGADHDILAPHRFDRLAEHLFGAVGRRGVEQIDPELDRLPNDRNRVGLALALRQPQLAEPAAAQPGNADPQSGVAQRCVFHHSPAVCLRRIEVCIVAHLSPAPLGIVE
jgi:hypothetical protein